MITLTYPCFLKGHNTNRPLLFKGSILQCTGTIRDATLGFALMHTFALCMHEVKEIEYYNKFIAFSGFNLHCEAGPDPVCH